MSLSTARTEDVSGLRKTAILLLQMGPERAAKVLAEMREAEVEEISGEIVRLQNVDEETTTTVLTEFHRMANARTFMAHGGADFANEMLTASVGNERAAEIMERLRGAFTSAPFQFLHKADPRQVLTFLQDEHPQTIAVVLAHMAATRAALVLGGLAPELQADVAHRIAVMERTSPEIIRQVEVMLERKISSVLDPGEMSEVGGLEPLVEIINRSDRATERLILEGLEGRDPQLADEVRSRMFVFEDITLLDDRAVQLVLRQVESAELATALKGVREDVRDKVLRNLSERAAENLRDEIELLGPVRLSTVEKSQAKVVQAIRGLEESGQVTIQRGNEDEMVV
jgi:flagellar motor switch protein FliG